MSFVNLLRGVKAKVDIEPVEDGNVILQDNGDGTADLFVDKGNQRLHVIDSTQTSSGHTIWNAIKTALTQRTKLWFADAKVTDDSTEQATKVEVVQLIDDEDELTNAPDGVYQGDYDDIPEDVLDASMVAYKNGSVKDALDDTVSKSNGGTFNGNVVVDRANGTAETVGTSTLTIGNATSSGTAGNSTGRLALYGNAIKAVTLCADNIEGSHKIIQLPNKNGTLLVDSDLTPSTATTFAAGNTAFVNNVRRTEYAKSGNVVTFNIFFDLGASPTNGSVLFTINDSSLFPKINTAVPLVGTLSDSVYKVYLNTDGKIDLNSTIAVPATTFYTISGTYICV